MDEISYDPIEWLKRGGDWLSSWWSDGAVRVDTPTTGTRTATTLLVGAAIGAFLIVSVAKGR
jgi:hypothetical protein